MIKHPCIVPASTKEIHFFDNFYDKGLEWYESNFGSMITNESDAAKKITGESSPYYIFHPLVPSRVKSLVPNVKLILLLRNPVDRAISHYYHEVSMGIETLSLDDAIRSEEKRMEGQYDIVMNGQYSFNHQHFSYLSRGIYVDQIKRWLDTFPKERFKIIKSEDFFSTPSKIMSEISDFLGMENYPHLKYEKYNIGDYVQPDIKIQKYLMEYFKPHNERLYSFLDRNFDW